MYTFQQADKIKFKELDRLYSNFSNASLSKLYGKFSFGKEIIKKASGEYLYTDNNKKILDMTGGLGVANMGHNHPRILKVRKEFQSRKYVEIHKNYLNRFLAAASKNLSDILPKDLNYSFFCNSGAEAVDGALKISYKYHQGKRSKVLKSDRSFHGKTIGAGSLSTGDNFVAGNARFSFQKIPGVLTYEFNNPESVLKLIEKNKNDIYAIFIEPFSCSTLTESSYDFLNIVFRACRKNNIVIIFDEIYSGFAKCGNNFYMEKYGFSPDIVCLSKSLGAGKSSISAYVSSNKIYKKSYGSLAGALMHSTTYNSFGEECATVIEATNILIDEEISKKSLALEKIIFNELSKLKENYPDQIKEIRGAGTHFGIIMNVKLKKLQPLLSLIPIPFFQDPLFLNKLVVTAYIEEYYKRSSTVCAFTSNMEVIWNISPAPISDPKIIAKKLKELNEIFKLSQFNVVKKFIIKNLL